MEEKTRINWFPGHMTKALRQMEGEIKNVDLLFYVLDARAPLSSLNPKLEKLATNKKFIYILSKADMVDEKELEKFKNKLQKENSYCIFLDSTKSNSSHKLFELSKNILQEKIASKKEKGINYELKAMVVGVPNVGKSTLINNLCKYAKTITGNKPGVTKGKQWVDTKMGLILLDTPGTLWPSFDNKKTANNLAYIGSIKDDVLDFGELAFSFIEDTKSFNKKNLEERYKIKILDSDETLDIFDKICFSRGALLKGKEPDYDRGGKIIIDDFRKCRLGKIILDDLDV